MISQTGYTIEQLQPLWEKNALGTENVCPPGGGPFELYDTFLATGEPGAPSFSAEQEYRNIFSNAWHQANPQASDAEYLANAATIYNAPPNYYTNQELAFLAKMFGANGKPLKS